MKRIKGGKKVVTGQVDANTYQGQENKIHLFDGKFTTGYRVTKFIIMENTPTGTYEAVAKLTTEPRSDISQWNWDDIREIAWAANFAPSTASGWMGDTNLIRPDNMVIEDLYISIYSTTDTTRYNFMIELDKYEFTAWDGAGILVQNNSQAGPS